MTQTRASPKEKKRWMEEIGETPPLRQYTGRCSSTAPCPLSLGFLTARPHHQQVDPDPNEDKNPGGKEPRRPELRAPVKEVTTQFTAPLPRPSSLERGQEEAVRVHLLQLPSPRRAGEPRRPAGRGGMGWGLCPLRPPKRSGSGSLWRPRAPLARNLPPATERLSLPLSTAAPRQTDKQTDGQTDGQKRRGDRSGRGSGGCYGLRRGSRCSRGDERARRGPPQTEAETEGARWGRICGVPEKRERSQGWGAGDSAGLERGALSAPGAQ